jgi:hypothetical protein
MDNLEELKFNIDQVCRSLELACQNLPWNLQNNVATNGAIQMIRHLEAKLAEREWQDEPGSPGLYIVQQYSDLEPVGECAHESGYKRREHPKLERMIIELIPQSMPEHRDKRPGWFSGYKINRFYGPIPEDSKLPTPPTQEASNEG